MPWLATCALEGILAVVEGDPAQVAQVDCDHGRCSAPLWPGDHCGWLWCKRGFHTLLQERLLSQRFLPFVGLCLWSAWGFPTFNGGWFLSQYVQERPVKDILPTFIYLALVRVRLVLRGVTLSLLLLAPDIGSGGSLCRRCNRRPPTS